MNKNMPEEKNPAPKDNLYFPVSPLTIFPGTRGEFRIYLQSEGQFVLYTKEMEQFSEQHRKRLREFGVDSVFIPHSQKDQYSHYVEKHIGSYLNNQQVPVASRASAFYDTSTTLVKDVFETKLPDSMRMNRAQFRRISKFVKQTLDFVSSEKSFSHIAKLVSKDYKTYTHSINTFVYTMCLLSTYSLDEDTLSQTGVGSILHDIGKSGMPPHLLDTPIRELSFKDQNTYRSHPARGVALCSSANLGSTTLNCILLHHEHEDGTGYPSGVGGEDLPLPVKALALANKYDNLTAGREQEQQVAPYDALKLIREKHLDCFDKEVYKRLVLLLSGANLV